MFGGLVYGSRLEGGKMSKQSKRLGLTGRTVISMVVALVCSGQALAQVCTVPAVLPTTFSANSYFRGTGTHGGGGDTTVTFDTVAGARATPTGTPPSGNWAISQTPIAAGDLVYIIQMQDADINNADSNLYGSGVAGNNGSGQTALNSTGFWEFRQVQSSAGGTITFTQPLQNVYTQQPATATATRKTFQIVRVPIHGALNLGATDFSVVPWDGFTGGVFVLESQSVNLNGRTINADAAGFRGGGSRNSAGTSGSGDVSYRTVGTATTLIPGGQKGEGTAGTPFSVRSNTTTTGFSGVDAGLAAGDLGYPDSQTSSRGAPGNAGGGGTSHNAGGGGGANAGNGGNGGDSFGFYSATNTGPTCVSRTNTQSGTPATYFSCTGDGSRPVGGRGGQGLTPSAQRLLAGGGGGAGDNNNASDNATFPQASGGNGGGIIFIRSGAVSGTGTLSADGQAGQPAGRDAAGGGGAGGTIAFAIPNPSTPATLAGVTARARGANGGNSGRPLYGGETQGTGAGGGGGAILKPVNVSLGTTDFTPGNPGTNFPLPSGQGSPGGTVTTTIGSTLGATSGAGGLANIDFQPANLPNDPTCIPNVVKAFNAAIIRPGETSSLTLTITNRYDQPATLTQPLVDTMPAGVTINTAVAPTLSAGCTGTGAVALTSTTVTVPATRSIAARVGTTNGVCTITVQVTSSAVGGYNNQIAAGDLTTNFGAAPATNAVLTVFDPTKSVRVQTDTAPTGTVNIGDTVRYTITYSLPAGATTISNFQIWDVLPSQVNPVPTGGANVTVTATGAGTSATENTAYTGVAGATTSSLLNTGATLAAGGSITVTIDAVINATATAPFNNTARAEGSGLPAVTGNGTGGGVPTDARQVSATFPELPQTSNTTLGDPTVVIPVLTPPTVGKGFVPPYVVPGGISRLTITLTNSNPIEAVLSAAFSDTMPGSVILGTPTNVATTCLAPGSGSTVATPTTTTTSVGLPTGVRIPANSSCTLSVDVLSNSAGSFNNVIAANTLQTNVGNAALTAATLVVAQPQKSVRLFTDADTSGAPSVGDTLEYRIVFNNPNTPDPGLGLTQFQISDPTLAQLGNATNLAIESQAGTTPAATANAAFTGKGANTTLLTSPVTLAAGGSIIFTFRAPIVAATPNPINNTATVNSNLAGFPAAGLASDADVTATATFTNPLAQPNDVDTPAQTNPTQVTVAAPNADLVVTKSQPSATVNAGGTIVYTVTVTNNGPATANNVVVTDTLPAGTTFVSVTGGGVIGTPTPSGGVLTLNGTNTSTLASLANGASQVFTITVTAP
jgi:uncharacterized repeat protein (TIGR01451 family)/fimbrial isopeptide formation D2 family protein